MSLKHDYEPNSKPFPELERENKILKEKSRIMKGVMPLKHKKMPLM